MTLHYLVIWILDKNMNTRKETPFDLTVDNRDQDSAETRYDAIVSALSEEFNVNTNRISIVNICRL